MSNQLHHLDEFKKLLTNYTPSMAAARTLRQTQLVLLVGPAVSGRNTIIKELLKTNEYHYIVSDTTREPRKNDGVMEQSGKEYWFRKEDDVLADIKAGLFLEAAVIHMQQVSGISIKEIETALAAEQTGITEVEIAGAASILSHKPDTVAIFVVPPDFSTWMQRMSARGKLPEDEIQRRLQSAAAEFSAALTNDYYHIVVNDVLLDAIAEVHTLVRLDISDPIKQAANRRVVEALYKKTLEHLKEK